MMTNRKDKFAIISYFQKKYQEITGGKLVINKYTAQWDADALIESYEMQPLKQMIDRYFALSEHPSWKGFCKDAQKIWEVQAIESLDIAHRNILKQRAKEWMNE